MDKKGHRPDPHKINAIINLSLFDDISALRSFLGMVKYQIFVNNLHQVRQPLDKTRKRRNWHWSVQNQQGFQQIRKYLVRSPFNALWSDASSLGIGAFIQYLLSDGNIKADAHASPGLTPAKKNYNQIERVLVLSTSYLHIYYLYLSLYTDHKPLLAIFGNKKGIPTHTTNRLQRIIGI